MSFFKRLFSSGKPEPTATTFDPERSAADAVPDTPPDRRTRKRRNAKRGLTALIIDDSPTIIAALSKTLRSAGYVTVEAATAEIGLEMAKETRPHLIFLDIVLPGMNGFAALRLLRKDPQTQATPIIMISGNEHATEQFYANRIGADDFMKKPFSRLEVFSRIDNMLDSNLIPCRKNMPPAAATPPPPAPAASRAAPAPTVDTQKASFSGELPPGMTALEARKELNAMGLQYFDQEQYNAAARRSDQLAVALFIRGGGVVPNPEDSNSSVVTLAKNKGQAALAAVRKNSNE